MSTLASLFRLPATDEIGRTRITSAQAILRGLRGRCPNCGRGRLFSRFLKVVDTCAVCGEELFHQRADDFPPYIVIVLVGHTIVPLALLLETEYSPPMWLQFALWGPATIGLALALLQPVKGAVVAIQWYGQMHGFGPSGADEAEFEG
jgi:uncharacterized protein (DUF983 family)